MTEERNKRDFEAIESVLNNMGFNEPEVAKLLANTHPTLQQRFMSLVAEFIHQQALKTYSDGRNEATVKVCRILSKKMIEENAFFPFI